MRDYEYIIRKWKKMYDVDFQIKSEWEKTKSLILFIGLYLIDD